MHFTTGKHKVKTKTSTFIKERGENYSSQTNLPLRFCKMSCLLLGSLLSTRTDFPGSYSELGLCNHNSDYIISRSFSPAQLKIYTASVLMEDCFINWDATKLKFYNTSFFRSEMVMRITQRKNLGKLSTFLPLISM